MDAERWRKIEQLYHATLKCEPTGAKALNGEQTLK